MMVIPAIDLKDGRCVRLYQGRPDLATVYSDDPVQTALEWQAQGAELLHVVDLDGAFEGRLRNLRTVERIARAVTIPVQLGGGIRNLAAVQEILAAGVARVILGTVAVEDPALVHEACRRFGPERILVGIDAREGRVAVRGWVEATSQDAYDLALYMKRLGVREIVFTDIARDGTLQGPAFDSLARMCTTGLKVIASGGVSSLDDVRRLRTLRETGLSGVIIGKALYTGDIVLREAIAVARGEAGPIAAEPEART